MSQVHPTAIVDKAANIAADVKIGAYSIIGPNVNIKAGVEIMSHVCIEGHTTIGEGTIIFPFSVIGFPPPDLKYKGEDSRLVIGKHNVIREHVTMHTGTAVDRNETTIGDNCLFMANSHVAHDCVIGDGVIMANCAALGGHAVIENYAIIGGLAAVQQRVRIGAYSIVGGMSGIDGDLIPFGRAVGDRARLAGLNTIGLKRNNISNAQIMAMNKAFKMLFLDENEVFDKRIEEVSTEFSDNEFIMYIIDFLKDKQTTNLCKAVKEDSSSVA